MSKTFQTVPPCSYNKPQVARISGESGLKTKVLVVLLMLLVNTHSLPTVFGTPDDPFSPNYQSSVLENLREAAESRRDELLYLFEEEIPSDILVKLQEAIVRMNEASQLEEFDHSAAAPAYLDALKMFRGAWEAYSDYKPEVSEESLVAIIEVSGPEPQPEGIEEKIKNNKKKRIEKFQEKILKNIEEEESADLGAVDSVFETVKSGLKNLKKMLKEGSLAAAVEVLKITTNRYQDGVDEILAKETSKLDKSNNGNGNNSKESESEDESGSKPVNENSNIGEGDTPEDKSTNGKGIDTDKTNNGNLSTKDEQETQPQVEDKPNNGNGNEKTDSDSNTKEKSNNGNGNNSKDSDESEEDPKTEPENDKTNNGKGNGPETPEDETQTHESSKKDDKKKSNNGKKK